MWRFDTYFFRTTRRALASVHPTFPRFEQRALTAYNTERDAEPDAPDTPTMPPRPAVNILRRAASTLAETPAAAASGSKPARVYPERKAFLFKYYEHLLQRSQLVLLFKHANLSVAQSTALRNAIHKIPVPAAPAALQAAAEGSETPAEPERATVTVARTGILAPVVRNLQAEGQSLEPFLQGQTALITCPSISPRYLKQVLAAVDLTIAKNTKKAEKKDEVLKNPEFSLVAGVLEGNRLMDSKQIKAVSQLPELDQLRAQLLGLLEMPGRQLLGVLNQAGGGGLVRTLQGLEESLKKDAAPPS